MIRRSLSLAASRRLKDILTLRNCPHSINLAYGVTKAFSRSIHPHLVSKRVYLTNRRDSEASMAPALVDSYPTAPHLLKQGLPVGSDGKVDRRIFPDGLKTSGQQNPIYTLLRPYSEYPKEITGPTVWKAEDYSTNPARWTHVFEPDEIAELSETADRFIASGVPLTAISRATFPLPNISNFLGCVRDMLLNRRGFILCKGLPVQEWGLQKSAVAYMGLGTHLGYFVSQNGRGHVLGHVKDLGEDPTKTDKVRIYRTNAR